MIVSVRHRLAFAGVIAACGAIALTLGAPARAMPQTVDYHCKPAWPEGDTLTLDWNSGHKSINAQFPNGSEMRMETESPGSGFRYGEADTEIYGKSQQRVFVQEGGEPLRTCVAE